jgi:hypothetical protein
LGEIEVTGVTGFSAMFKYLAFSEKLHINMRTVSSILNFSYQEISALRFEKRVVRI